MSVRYAILCPGQGGQHAGMFDLVREHEQGVAVVAQLEQALRTDGAPGLPQLLRDPDCLFANRYAQALIVAAGLAGWHALRSELPAPALVTGYSAGELTACSVAGMWTAEATIEVALARARFMDACLASAPQQGLMAVSGLPLHDIAQLLQQHGAYVAIETGFDSLIAGARTADLQALQIKLEAAAARCVILPVSVASHTPLMAAARAPLAELLDQLSWHMQQVPLIAGVQAQQVHSRLAASTSLLQQLTSTIHWSACMDACAEQGVGVALELGPGSALTRMLRERHPHIECRSLADFRTIAGALSWMHQRLD